MAERSHILATLAGLALLCRDRETHVAIGLVREYVRRVRPGEAFISANDLQAYVRTLAEARPIVAFHTALSTLARGIGIGEVRDDWPSRRALADPQWGLR
jgi:hypothetical protein